MVHYVVGQVDSGEPVVVKKVELREGEGLEELEDRMHREEHVAIVEGAAEVLKQRAARKAGKGAV